MTNCDEVIQNALTGVPPSGDLKLNEVFDDGNDEIRHSGDPEGVAEVAESVQRDDSDGESL